MDTINDIGFVRMDIQVNSVRNLNIVIGSMF